MPAPEYLHWIQYTGSGLFSFAATSYCLWWQVLQLYVRPIQSRPVDPEVDFPSGRLRPWLLRPDLGTAYPNAPVNDELRTGQLVLHGLDYKSACRAFECMRMQVTQNTTANAELNWYQSSPSHNIVIYGLCSELRRLHLAYSQPQRNNQLHWSGCSSVMLPLTRTT